MAVDISGGVFSLLSLAFRRKFDVVASTTYITVIVSVLNHSVSNGILYEPHSFVVGLT